MDVFTQVTSPLRTLGRLAGLIVLSVMVGCSDSPKDTTIEEPKVDHPEFTAKVSGAVNAEVVGSGIVTYLGPKERDEVMGNRPGYFLLANINGQAAGKKGFTITFRIPEEAQPGNHELMTPDARTVGEHFDVRLERMEEGRLISYHANTDGTITLKNFAPDRTYPNISTITGTFQFVTENNEGERVSAKGTFNFPFRRKVAFLYAEYIFPEFLRA